jgi:hypothetical protein
VRRQQLLAELSEESCLTQQALAELIKSARDHGAPRFLRRRNLIMCAAFFAAAKLNYVRRVFCGGETDT